MKTKVVDADSSKPPKNCPWCNGERDWDIPGKVAICHFCGKREDIREIIRIKS